MKTSPGLYQIQSKSHPERIYFGSAVNMSKRWYTHLYDLRKNNHHSPKLQNHYNKYGESDLEFIRLSICNKEELIKTEQSFLDLNDYYFNICKIAGSKLGIKSSPATIEKQRVSGKKYKCSEATKIKIKEARKRQVFSIDTRIKMGNSHKKPILQYSKQGIFIKEWESALDASKELLIDQSQIRKCVSGKAKSCGGFIWKSKKY